MITREQLHKAIDDALATWPSIDQVDFTNNGVLREASRDDEPITHRFTAPTEMVVTIRLRPKS